MPIAEPLELTPKAVKTRTRILNVALELFASKGYHATTLREIAAAADVSLGLTYRYFSAKEDLIVALYARFADEFDEWVTTLQPGSLGKRIGIVLRADLDQLRPFREGFSALFQVGLNPSSGVSVLGEGVGEIRKQVWGTFLKVILGSKDSPREKQAHELATIMYAAHLMIILFWLQDRSFEQKMTQELIVFIEDTLSTMRPLLNLPVTAKILTRFAGIVEPMFGPGADS